MQYKSITRVTLVSYLDDYLQRGPATVFASLRGLRLNRCSYIQLVLTAGQTASELLSRGIAKGDRVILCGENSAEWAAAFWGCLLRGVVVVPLDKDSTPEFALSVQQQTAAKLVFASHEATAVSQLNLPLIQLEDLIDSVSANQPEPMCAGDLDENTLAQIIFTSGTTSIPQGVMLTHGNLLANLLPIEAEIGKYLKWERFFHPVRFLNLVPLSHVFGQFMGLFVPQLLGAEVHFHESFNPAEIVERVRKHRISVIVLVPRVLESLRQWLERHYAALGKGDKLKERLGAAADTKFLRRWWIFRRVHSLFGWKFWAVLSGGATLDEQTASFWRRMGFAVLQGYGMTETSSLISVTHPFKANGGSIGKLMPGYEVKLDDAGEIVVRGPSVSPGYWTAAGQVSRNSDAWLHTGDLGTLDESGHLHFKGRKKDVIVTAAGLNIYPEDLEDALNRQPEVRSSCVIKWQGAQGDEPMAVMILNNSASKVERIIESANKDLSEYQRIRRWHIWDAPAFPLTATQKILKREVAAAIEREVARQLTPLNSSTPNFVLSEASRISGVVHSGADETSLKLTTDLKLDSLGRIELLSALEDRFQIDIDEASFTEATTVGDVERIIRGEAAEVSKPYPYPTWSHRFPVTWLRVVLFYTIILPVTRVMSRMRVEGVEHLEKLNEPVLFVSNHVTLGDHALILAALPLRLRHRLAIAMEGERLRGWIHPPQGTKLLLRVRMLAQYFLVTTFFNVFPLPKKSGFRRSFAYAAECVERGFNVLVFPEGLRAPRGQMQMSKFKTGIGLLAAELGIPVVPVMLHGLYELKRRRQYFADKNMVSVSFGAAVRFDRSLSPAAITEELQRQLEAL
jgi:long-chain acyl-CoA synthetase